MNAAKHIGRSEFDMTGRVLQLERGVYAASTDHDQPSLLCRASAVIWTLKRAEARAPERARPGRSNSQMGWDVGTFRRASFSGRCCARGRARSGAGFSLVEVMIAIVILAVAVVGLTQGFTTALASSKDSEQQTTAALFAAGQIETLRASTGLTDETTEGDCGDELPMYRWRQTISPAGVDGLHEVTVAVEHAKTGVLIYELKTLLFEVPATTPEKSQKPKSKGGAGE